MKNGMKAILCLLFAFIMLFAFGCGANNVQTSESGEYCSPQEERETVTLTLDNLSTYIATNSSSTYFSDKNHTMYYTYFIGSDHCKFTNCVIICKYTGEATSKIYTVKLNLSGDGEVPPYYVRNSGMYTYSSLIIESVSGTVEILK